MAAKPARAPRLFFLYAHPCGDVLAKRGTIGKKDLASLRARLASGKPFNANPRMFEKAFGRLSAYAKRRGRRVSAALVREYFLSEHNRVVKKIAKSAKDVIPGRCFVTPCRIVSVKGASALAETPHGKKKINVRFVKGLRKGDFVSAHYFTACEKIPRGALERMRREFHGRSR
ncbi:MAG: hypothetical protein PHF51_04580 [Candidatus ainarchaeum sp.]|nr:hypothetical protein [Candidatus ainarchaeum sp.]